MEPGGAYPPCTKGMSRISGISTKPPPGDFHGYGTYAAGIARTDGPSGRPAKPPIVNGSAITSCTIAGGLLTFNNICSSDASCPGDGYRGARQRRILSIDLSMEDV